jgi:hypothetical protein
MTASFPASVHSFASLTDGVDDVLAAHQNDRALEIAAIETYLLNSLNPITNGNYVITPSIATNDLTVAIKSIAGTDASATNPIRFKIGNTVYTLSTSASYTKVHGTNWHNAGSAELAAAPIDFFMYAIAETGASAGLKFGHSRIPYALTMNDFVNTTTSEKYIAGNWTNFNATDVVQNIGRFRAQLSASAGFNWSIATALVINYPIFITDFLNWNPTLAGFSINPTSTLYYYRVFYKDVTIRSRQGANGTSNATNFTMTTPFTTQSITNGAWQNVAFPVFDNGAVTTTPGMVQITSASSTIALSKLTDGSSSAWTNVNGKRVGYFELNFPIAA